NAQNVVPHIIRDVHHSVATNDDAVADAVAGQHHKHFTFPVGHHLADGLLPVEIDGVDIPLGVTGWSLDATREGIFRRQWPGYEQRFFGSLRGLLQLSTGQKQSSEGYRWFPASTPY